MSKEKIRDLESLKKFLKNNVRNPVFGVGVHAFNRLGLENVLPKYRIITLRYSLDTALIEKDMEVFSLEKGMGTKHINAPRNSTTVLCHPRTQTYLNSFKEQPVIIPYKASYKMERVCQKNNWILAASGTRFGKALFEDKIKFRRILEKIGIAVPPGETARFKNLNYKELREKYGLPFVIQHPRRGGGKGTFFIKNEDNFKNAFQKIAKSEDEDSPTKENLEKLELIVAKFIKGSSPSIIGCVTRHGILMTTLQHQVLDIPECYNPEKGSGLFCGHDWTASRFSDDVYNVAFEYVEKIGKYFQKNGYKGIFGIDMVLEKDTNKLYVVEANPRLVAQFPTILMAQFLNNEPLILAFHLLEYLRIDYNIDVAQINKLMQQPKKGAHLFLHNLSGRWARNKKTIRAGVYVLRGNELQYKRPGYDLKHIKNNDEFIITESVPLLNSYFSPNRRLVRILTLKSVIKKHDKLNNWAQKVVTITYNAFCLKPIRFFKIIRFFNPNYLVKG